jgi:hypothetical protein
MQAAIYIQVPHEIQVPDIVQVPHVIQVPHPRDTLIPADIGGCSYQNRVVILSEARSAEKPALSEVEGKDLRLSSSLRRIC